jgi:hypothetical protein
VVRNIGWVKHPSEMLEAIGVPLVGHSRPTSGELHEREHGLRSNREQGGFGLRGQSVCRGEVAALSRSGRFDEVGCQSPPRLSCVSGETGRLVGRRHGDGGFCQVEGRPSLGDERLCKKAQPSLFS